MSKWIYSFTLICSLSSGPLRAETLGDLLNQLMKDKPAGALKGNCLGACKGGLTAAGLLPKAILRAHNGDVKEGSRQFQSYEGIFSDDLYERPYAYQRLFQRMGISDENFQTYIDMATGPQKVGTLALRRLVYPLVFSALGLEANLGDKIMTSDMETSRKIFYTAITQFKRETENRNLEFWNLADRNIYNVLFGEFNYAWMAMLDIFESDDFNPNEINFKRIFPERREDIGVAIYTPNKKGPEGSLEVNLQDSNKIPVNAIVIYRVGSAFSRAPLREKEVNWADTQLKVSELWDIDHKPGHIECITTSKEGRCFCSDGKMTKPATEWNSNREVLAIYLPQH